MYGCAQIMRICHFFCDFCKHIFVVSVDRSLLTLQGICEDRNAVQCWARGLAQGCCLLPWWAVSLWITNGVWAVEFMASEPALKQIHSRWKFYSTEHSVMPRHRTSNLELILWHLTILGNRGPCAAARPGAGNTSTDICVGHGWIFLAPSLTARNPYILILKTKQNKIWV